MASLLKPVGDWFNRFGGDCGGMHVSLEVEAAPGVMRTLHWNLVARQGHGPEIPCIAAIVLARKLAAGEIATPGALPCMGLMSLAEFTSAVSHLDIHWAIT